MLCGIQRIEVSIIGYRVGEIYQYAMQPRHRIAVDPDTTDGSITDTGALCAYSGLRTGRSPMDKRTVLDDNTKDVTLFKIYLVTIESMVGYSEFSNLSRRGCQK